jgi:hypothetical protein
MKHTPLGEPFPALRFPAIALAAAFWLVPLGLPSAQVGTSNPYDDYFTAAGDVHFHHTESSYRDQSYRYFANGGPSGSPADVCGASSTNAGAPCTSNSDCGGLPHRCLNSGADGHAAGTPELLFDAAIDNGLAWLNAVNHSNQAEFDHGIAFLHSAECLMMGAAGVPQQLIDEDFCGGFLLPDGSRTDYSWEWFQSWGDHYASQGLVGASGVELASPTGHVVGFYPTNSEIAWDIRSGHRTAPGSYAINLDDYVARMKQSLSSEGVVIAAHPGPSNGAAKICITPPCGFTANLDFDWDAYTEDTRQSIDAMEVNLATLIHGGSGAKRATLDTQLGVCDPIRSTLNWSKACRIDTQCGGVAGSCQPGLGLRLAFVGGSDGHGRLYCNDVGAGSCSRNDTLPGAESGTFGGTAARTVCFIPNGTAVSQLAVAAAMHARHCYQSGSGTIEAWVLVNETMMGDVSNSDLSNGLLRVRGRIVNTASNLAFETKEWTPEYLRIVHNATEYDPLTLEGTVSEGCYCTGGGGEAECTTGNSDDDPVCEFDLTIDLGSTRAVSGTTYLYMKARGPDSPLWASSPTYHERAVPLPAHSRWSMALLIVGLATTAVARLSNPQRHTRSIET